jgi:diguanylate cyclase (GGDEF)-like protein
MCGSSPQPTARPVSAVAVWWRRPDHYQWISQYLASRHLQKLIRSMMAVSTVILSSITLAMTWSPAGPHRIFGDATALAAVAVCMALALLWACRWPTQRQSVCYALGVLTCTAIVCLSYSDRLFGLLGCMSFAVLGGYIAFFHSARLLVVNLAVASATALTLTIMLAATTGDLVRAVCAFLEVAVALGSVPFAANALVQNLGVDVRQSDVDPLCGLLNRRAFYPATRALVAAHTGRLGDRCLAITLVDLDHFKHLNDKHGHVVGDRALITIADVLRDNTDQDAVVARIGGEEFLIADLIAHARIRIQAERLRSAIASTVFEITASVGVASIPLSQASVPRRDVIDNLIKIADAAMYDAKRAGGDQTRHHATT